MRTKMAESVAVGYALKMALQAPIEAATKFETAMLDIAQKAELSDGAMNTLGQRLRDMAPGVNQSAMSMARAMDTLLGMGMDGKTAESVLPTLGKTATAYTADIADLSKTAMAAIDNLKLKAEELPRAMDMLARSGMEGAFELKDMAQYFAPIAAMGEVVGMRGADGVAQLAAALQITRKGAGDSAEAATNLRNVLQKMTSEQVVGKFEKLGGIDLKAALEEQTKAGVLPLEAFIRTTRDVLEKSGGKLKVSDLFTDMQMQLAMASLTAQYEEFARIQELTKNSDGLVNKDFERRLQTMGSKMAGLTAAWETFKITAGGALAPSLLPLLKQLTELSTRVAKLAEAYPNLARAVVTATTLLIGGRIAAIGIGWAFLSMKAAVLSAALGVATLGAAIRGAAVASFVGVATRAAAAMTMLRQALASLVVMKSVGGLGMVLSTLGSSLLGLLSPVRLVSGAMLVLRGALMLTGIGVALAGIAAAGSFIYNNWSGIGSAFTAFGSAFMTALGPAKPAVDGLVSGLKSIWNSLTSLTGPLKASTWKEWGTAAGTAVGQFVSYLSELPQTLAHKGVAWVTLGHDLGMQILEGLKSAASAIISYVQGLASRIGSAVSGAVSGIAGKVKGALPGGSAPAPAAPEARASGGPVSAGRPYLVGEQGPELITPTRSGYVHPNGSFGAQAGGMTIHQTMTFNVSGNADEDVVDKIRRVLRDEVRETFRGVFSDTSMRFA
ncbi:MAG: phage tail tape measure protein [Hyphomicrobium sp. 32-62-53]|nr:MAG: phage tail tape measure protein [Hyphomicrobium sp. 12-62-95]OYX97344.1 MAG: phage tail tape measure protein [Hyphomicrobium sp. 32-62-53]